MANVGDRIRLSTGKGANREGVVVAVTGAMVRVRWASNDETSVVPAPGTMTVLAPPRTRKKAAAPGLPAKAPAATKEAPPAKKAAATKKAGATGKVPATKKKAPAAKRGSR